MPPRAAVPTALAAAALDAAPLEAAVRADRPPVRALVFDFDGLLVDTETVALRAWEAVLAELGVELPHDVWHAAIGGQGAGAAMLGYLADQLGHAEAVAVHETWWARHLSLVNVEPLRPGVAGYLTEAVRLGLGLAIASSATGDWVAGHLVRLGTHEVFSVVATGDTNAAKPAPDTYLAALSGLGVPAAQAIAFEDSPTGVLAAKSAGLRCVAVPNPATSLLAFPGADVVLYSLDDVSLPDLLHRLGMAA
jgi:HAD superfamily hydrolase (TIGR01509 family)